MQYKFYKKTTFRIILTKMLLIKDDINVTSSYAFQSRQVTVIFNICGVSKWLNKGVRMSIDNRKYPFPFHSLPCNQVLAQPQNCSTNQKVILVIRSGFGPCLKFFLAVLKIELCN